jgi:hypothetical protein
MALLSDIVNYCFTSQGQYIVGGLSAFNLTLGQIWAAFQPEVANYQRYVPLRKHFNINGAGFFRYDFGQDPNNPGYSNDNPTNITMNESLIATSTQTFTIQMPHFPIFPTTVVVKIGGVDAAVDSTDGQGILVFNGSFNATYSGSINYATGLVTIKAVGIGSPVMISVEILADYTTLGSPPIMIYQFTPVGTMQVISVLAYWMSPMVRNIYSPDRLLEPRMFLYKYEPPMLYYTESGQFDVIANYDYLQVPTYDDNNNLLEMEIVGIEDSSNYYVFLQLCAARFLQILGRSKRAFIYNDLGLTTDAAVLVEEGMTQYKEAMALLLDRHSWWSGLHV